MGRVRGTGASSVGSENDLSGTLSPNIGREHQHRRSQDNPVDLFHVAAGMQRGAWEANAAAAAALAAVGSAVRQRDVHASQHQGSRSGINHHNDVLGDDVWRPY